MLVCLELGQLFSCAADGCDLHCLETVEEIMEVAPGMPRMKAKKLLMKIEEYKVHGVPTDMTLPAQLS